MVAQVIVMTELELRIPSPWVVAYNEMIRLLICHLWYKIKKTQNSCQECTNLTLKPYIMPIELNLDLSRFDF